MRKPKTFTTLECVARDVRRAKTVDDAVAFLSAYVARVANCTSVQTHAENHRLRGEVRRLRRVIRDAIGQVDPSYAHDLRDGDQFRWLRNKLRAALAPRRRKKP